MQLTCSNCQATIKPENINVATDIAKCDQCGSIMKLSELVNAEETEEIEVTPPAGSKILMERGLNSQMTWTLPKRGFSLGLVPQLVFATFWLGFVAVWTTLASFASILFAMFSIPFWIVGIVMVVNMINAAFESQRITLNKSTLRIDRLRPVKSKSVSIALDGIQSIKLTAKGLNSNNLKTIGNVQSGFSSSEIPAVITGSKTEYFFEKASGAEQKWVTRLLDGLVREMR